MIASGQLQLGILVGNVTALPRSSPRDSRRFASTILAAAFCVISSPARAQNFVEFPIPTAASEPLWIATGADGNLWFTEQTGNKIGRITTAGVVTETGLPNVNSNPIGIAAGPDGNLWFTEIAGNRIGKITPSGTMTEFALAAGSGPEGIAAGSDANLWFTENSAGKIGRISTAGTLSEFAIPTANSGPGGIAVGPDGNLWFVETNANKIGRISAAPSLVPMLDYPMLALLASVIAAAGFLLLRKNA